MNSARRMLSKPTTESSWGILMLCSYASRMTPMAVMSFEPRHSGWPITQTVQFDECAHSALHAVISHRDQVRRKPDFQHGRLECLSPRLWTLDS